MKKKSYGNAFIVSCILHLVGLLLVTLYIVQNEIHENEENLRKSKILEPSDDEGGGVDLTVLGNM